jgi:ABC-type transport system involved in cytochrome bd biosynthesis fused ATPase/permease subunit
MNEEDHAVFYSGMKEVLKNIDLVVKPGMKVCLVGRPGSGLSAFFLSLAGELVLTRGSLKANGKLSYLSSNNELFIPGTLKQNILLGERYDTAKFLKVIDTVELDLERFAAGEQIELLENATNISIDEMRKIMLARVLYHGGDILCLDNCFDDWYPIMSERIFARIVRDFCKKKTIFYSSSFNRLIKFSDIVLYFEDGRIKQQGRYIDLLC